ncbi:MAG TPA: ribosome maturation factor RimM [Burkholderiaceae bacterium]|nr:ribosome maturation factor RimM [Burkholderiaceae bacterium]
MSAAARPLGADPGWPEDAIEVGRIVDAWGLKGWIKVQPFAADPQALFSSRRWFLLPSEKVGPLRPAGVTSIPSLLRITQVKDHGDVVVALAQEVPDRSAAEALRGARVFIGRASFPSAGPDEFYWVDLIGLAVVNRAGERLGTVAGLIDTGPHSVLRVTPDSVPAGVSAQQAERLIPFVGAYVDEVSLEQRVVTVDWGLDY